MALTGGDTESAGTRAGLFATTHWSVVLAAGHVDSPQAAEALEQLCRTYWHPLYVYVRHRGYTMEEAQDLTQEFFYRLLSKHYLTQVDPRKGKFRSFLLMATQHFLANEWDRAHTVKRGGHVTFLSLEDDWAEQRYREVPSEDCTPDQAYERSWALALLERVLGRLRQEAAAAGREAPFDELKVFLTGEKRSVSYAELATKLSTTEAALKMAVQRLRHAYLDLLREEIAHTVADPNDVEGELRYLATVLGR